MNAAVTETLTGLDRALASGLLPSKASDLARSLRARLAAPIRVTVMGLPDTGKSRVIDLLAGDSIVPEGVRLPALRLKYGEFAMTRITRPDGSTEEQAGLDGAWAAGRRAVMVDMEAPLPALKRITLMEIGIGLGRIEQARACAWAAKQSELIIWCTRDFGAPEQAAWATMPDAIRDQAILLRPKIDLSPNPAAALDRAHRLAQDDFERVLAIDTPRALAARQGAEVDRAEFKASGGQSLIAAVLKVMDRTRQGYLDRADLLLARHPEAIEAVAPIARATPVVLVARVAPATPAPAPAAARSSSDAVAKLLNSVVSQGGDAAKAPAPALSEASLDLLRDAVTRLRSVGTELSQTEGKFRRTAMLDRSVEEIVELEERIADAQEDDPALSRAHEDVQAALDLIQLIQIENAPQAADDAVVLMLQLRRRFDRWLDRTPVAA
ncbi:hypothetical protein [Jannaschia seohaensis]|uniref:Uncharacterized protein n=1 Tax=Jannaschia seohaensis TaxID=475081 RepID=A0A2Y9B3G2_9RHOB|nr:hypothetical protein [Jannaschia seohaensis]PWJ12500.1 hypothetical protein BCF38_11658 [Jannaschia seohaensis]SSA50981.1 hypothetical protein SAMN05421539_11658 [Jannaschia seohaensis]